MNLKERDRLAMWSRVKDEQMMRKEAAARLGVSDRQGKRLGARSRAGGDAGLVHGLRGRPGHHRPLADARRERALALYRERYPGLWPDAGVAADGGAGRPGGGSRDASGLAGVGGALAAAS